MKQHMEESIGLDEEDLELGEESWNSIPETLIDKEKFKEVYERINKSSKDDKNKDKLRASNKKLLKQAKDKPEKIFKKIETLEEKLKKIWKRRD